MDVNNITFRQELVEQFSEKMNAEIDKMDFNFVEKKFLFESNLTYIYYQALNKEPWLDNMKALMMIDQYRTKVIDMLNLYGVLDIEKMMGDFRD